MNRDNPWIYVPGINFFGAVVVIVEGTVKSSPGLIVFGIGMGAFCAFSAYMMTRSGAR